MPSYKMWTLFPFNDSFEDWWKTEGNKYKSVITYRLKVASRAVRSLDVNAPKSSALSFRFILCVLLATDYFQWKSKCLQFQYNLSTEDHYKIWA